MYFVLVVIAGLTAVVGSYYPIKEIQKHSIAIILRGINL